MKTQTSLQAFPLTRSRWLDLLELTKPRIAVMVLFTVAVGALLSCRGAVDPIILAHALIGTALVAGGASALNQLLERHSDALMRRTENRPLPTGRLQPAEVLCFGALLGGGGLAYLATFCQPLATGVAAFTLVSYVCLYTPLKRRTSLNTLIGAVPGALPPVIGWAAMTGRIDIGALLLFLIVFLWQVPHFLAIAWIYRDDYTRAGLKMLPVGDEGGAMTARQMIVYFLALIPVSFTPVLYRQAGLLYGFGALALGMGFLLAGIGFLRHRTNGRARRVLQASLIYLPVLLALWLIEALVIGN